MRKKSSLLDKLLLIGLVVFLVVLPFHLVIKDLIPGPIGTYWKEMLLGLLVALWSIRCLQRRRLLLTDTPLDVAVLVYVGLLILRFVLDRSGLVGAWGLYVSAMYVPLFWLIPTVLRHLGGLARTRWVKGVFALLVIVGGIVALGGVVEFVLDTTLWPSEELTQRQGFPDMYIYGTHIRRVYFTFDSPATLANTLGLILPLALALVMVARRWWARALAGLAAALIAACIVVTFSRGIWVATAFSLVAMGVLSILKGRFLQGEVEGKGRGVGLFSALLTLLRASWRKLLVAGGALGLIGLVWLAVAALRPGQAASVHQNVVELSPTAYDNAPITRVVQDLIAIEPVHGHTVTQTWTLVDPITGHEDTRSVIYEHPPESGKVEIIYRVEVPENGAFRFAISLSPEVWSPAQGDGASFKLYVTEVDAPEEGQFAFIRYINPKHNPKDRRWRNFLVDLSPWAGQPVNLSLITTAGPAGDWAFDWAGWAEPQIVSVEPGYFVSAEAENAVLRHTGSILDWTTDDTNRDRLAAWSLSLDAWLESPLWGQGLGSTGVAALRTRPERALVTESQVLKALVELGLPGLLAWAFLWFQIARVGYRAYRLAEEKSRHWILLGILISLLTIFVEGWVYQNLEAKQVNAYFWTLVGTLAFLAQDRSNDVHSDRIHGSTKVASSEDVNHEDASSREEDG
jgi:hypothetical protein